jgi:hypothetical protein
MGTGGWNFQQMGMAAYSQELLEKWPTPFYISPSGREIKTGNRRLPKTPAANPVREAYRLWNSALTDGRSSWDQVAVLSVVRPNLFRFESHGRVERAEDGRVFWNPDVNRPHHHLVIPKASNQQMEQIIEELMARPPKTPRKSPRGPGRP